jgi:hypothetical protein
VTVTRLSFLAIAVVVAVSGCDPKFDETSSSPTDPPPGSTTNLGFVGANISGEQFSGTLTAAATVVESRLTFSAYDGFTRQLSISVGAPGPGTFEVGGPYNPTATLIESSGDAVRRWVSPAVGSLTLTFLTKDNAVGYFTFGGLLPDSATMAAGTTTRRNVTAGTFTVSLSR